MNSDEVCFVAPSQGVISAEQELSGASLTLDQIEMSRKYFRARGQVVDPNAPEDDHDVRGSSSHNIPSINLIVGQKVGENFCVATRK